MISYSFHLSSKKHSLSTCGKVSGASKHNLRKYESDEYDRRFIEILRGGDSYILDDVKAIYHQEFDEIVAEYNAGKRSDRQIEDYLKYVSDSGKNDVAAEVIIQIGDKEFWSDKTEEQKRTCVELLDEQIGKLEELVPDFKIASAVVHLDESSPHMHVIGVPVAGGYKRGPKKQATKTKVFTQESLQMLQEEMHQFAQNQIYLHPEIFDGEELKRIERGRNSDFSKEYYIRQKAEQSKALDEVIEAKKETVDSLEQMQTEMEESTQKMVEEYVQKTTEVALKNDFFWFVTQENPTTKLGELAKKVWNQFKDWWERTKKPKLEAEARESVLQKLQKNKELFPERCNATEQKKDKKKDQYR